MFDLDLTRGERVELREMLDAREYRQNLQRKLIGDYHVPLVSFTMNIVGPVKVFPLAVRTYEEGLRLIRESCKAGDREIINLKEVKQKTGYEALFSVKADPEDLKRMAVSLEDLPPLGRLFDIDIIQTDGTKVSRTDLKLPERKCLLCGNDAFLCSRSRTHTIAELLTKTGEIMQAYFDATEKPAVHAGLKT